MGTWTIKGLLYPPEGGRALAVDLAEPVEAGDDFDALEPVIAQAEQLQAEGAEAHYDLIVVVAENWNGRADEKAVGLEWTSREGYVGG